MTEESAGDGAVDARKIYYAEARSWASDKIEDITRSRRIAWLIAGVAIGVAIVEALVLIAMLPLKTVVPYTIMVDRNTGFAQILRGQEIPSVKAESALTQSLLSQYVVARETFDINSIQAQYNKVALWSADDAKREYLALMPAGNPDSPINRYRRTTVVDAEVESVTPISPDSALVRFYTERHDQGQVVGQRAYWVSLLRFRFSGEPMSIENRLDNPLGFQVIHYRRDQEAPPERGALYSTNADESGGVIETAPQISRGDQKGVPVAVGADVIEP